MINKQVTIVLTQEEINSPEPIEIKLIVKEEGGDEDEVEYIITYPK